MRIWSLHPHYLDGRGLVALWRETLLAQKVLGGYTRGYRNHPQLIRFRAQRHPLAAIATYLHAVCDEAGSRGYNFDRSRIIRKPGRAMLPVTRGQLLCERDHLLKKLRNRDRTAYHALRHVKCPVPHPLFSVVPGDIEDWERR